MNWKKNIKPTSAGFYPVLIMAITGIFPAVTYWDGERWSMLADDCDVAWWLDGVSPR